MSAQEEAWKEWCEENETDEEIDDIFIMTEQEVEECAADQLEDSLSDMSDKEIVGYMNISDLSYDDEIINEIKQKIKTIKNSKATKERKNEQIQELIENESENIGCYGYVAFMNSILEEKNHAELCGLEIIGKNNGWLFLKKEE